MTLCNSDEYPKSSKPIPAEPPGIGSGVVDSASPAVEVNAELKQHATKIAAARTKRQYRLSGLSMARTP
jgi:methionine synthase II (cobalamin-independent)